MALEAIGAFRTEQNWIGDDASGPRKAEFIGLIEDLVALCARTDMPPVIPGGVDGLLAVADGRSTMGVKVVDHAQRAA